MPSNAITADLNDLKTTQSAVYSAQSSNLPITGEGCAVYTHILGKTDNSTYKMGYQLAFTPNGSAQHGTIHMRMLWTNWLAPWVKIAEF